MISSVITCSLGRFGGTLKFNFLILLNHCLAQGKEAFDRFESRAHATASQVTLHAARTLAAECSTLPGPMRIYRWL